MSHATFAKVALFVIGSSAIAALLVSPRTRPGSWVWNFTPSIANGLYRLESRGWVKGDRVAVRPSHELAAVLTDWKVLQPDRLLLKRVAASSGDEVCRYGAHVLINDMEETIAKDRATDERELPHWHGCVVLSPSQVFLLGDVSASFDGRYFGVTSSADIVGRLTPVLTWSD